MKMIGNVNIVVLMEYIHMFQNKKEQKMRENHLAVILIVFLSFIVLVCVLVIVAKWNSGNKKCKVCGGTGYYEKKTCVFCDGTGESDINPYKEVYGN